MFIKNQSFLDLDVYFNAVFTIYYQHMLLEYVFPSPLVEKIWLWKSVKVFLDHSVKLLVQFIQELLDVQEYLVLISYVIARHLTCR